MVILRFDKKPEFESERERNKMRKSGRLGNLKDILTGGTSGNMKLGGEVWAEDVDLGVSEVED